MEKLFTRFLALGLIFIFTAGAAMAQGKMPANAKGGAKDHLMLNSSELKWMEGPASLPPGAKLAVLEGDPAKAGPFTMRAIFPPNYVIMPHYHPQIEHVTVMEGEFFMGHGDKYDPAQGTRLEVGGFSVMPAKFHHYAYTKDKQSVVQIHAIGPWDIIYLDAANDPRKAKKPGMKK